MPSRWSSDANSAMNASRSTIRPAGTGSFVPWLIACLAARSATRAPFA